jgi:RHH-type proline utilization regulon transcriptional repressor/proline dehydrogenase/delta 1-pyrroline-5-carboxylate dehydrogenase
VIYPQFATHNAGTIAAIVQMARQHGAQFELQRLHGMGQGIYREVLRDPSLACRIYAPVGRHRDLLAYLVRRLLENGANSSFVHQLADPSVGLDTLLRRHCTHRPRRRCRCRRAVRTGPSQQRRRRPRRRCDARTAGAALAAVPGATRADRARRGRAGAAACARRVPGLGHDAVGERAACLRRAADAMQQQLPRLSALLVREAAKTWGDAVSEVREAIDFLRYYAAQAETDLAPQTLPGPTGESNTLRLCGRGAWVCISPWNFPLAIFTGQVAAALVTGNTVLAKPAEQTPAIAREAVALLHAAGVPPTSLQLLPGPGETVGAALVAAPGIAGVVFTGSTEVARSSTGARRQGRPDRAADRRDRRHQRDGGRLDRAARAGGRRRGAERVPLGRPALLGAAAAVRARRHRRPRDRDDRGAARELVCGDPGAMPPPTSAR